jgi:hypothetical protein
VKPNINGFPPDHKEKRVEETMNERTRAEIHREKWIEKQRQSGRAGQHRRAWLAQQHEELHRLANPGKERNSLLANVILVSLLSGVIFMALVLLFGV